MSNFAYRDRERTEVILSKDATLEDKKRFFYCPNKDCPARLFIRSVNGITKAHFAAIQNAFPHTENCYYKNNSDNVAFHCSETEFIFDDAIECLCAAIDVPHSGKSSSAPLGGPCKEHPPRTIRQIYDVCRTHSINDKYGDSNIKDMILDRRTAHLYLSDWSGAKLVEASVNFIENHDSGHCTFYSRDLRQVYLYVPCSTRKIPLILDCQGDIYKTVQTHIYKNRNKTIVVAGVWCQSGDQHIAKIFSKAQVTSV